MMDRVKGERISLKRKAANPVFQYWLEELLDEAKVKKSKLEPMLQEALTSLSKYPLPLQTGADCAILQGFNRKLCTFLDQRLEVYHCRGEEESQSSSSTASNAPTSSENSVNCSPKSSENENTSTTNNSGTRQNRPESLKTSQNSNSNRKYKPVFRSGGYAILIALLEHSEANLSDPSLNKEQLIERAQKYAEESFVRPKPNSFYNAWSNMKTLIKKNLVKRTRDEVNKSRYSLTEEGLLLAKALQEDNKNRPTANDLIFNGPSISADNSQRTCSDAVDEEMPMVTESRRAISEETIVLSPGSFDIILLIDKQETSGVSKKNDPTVAQFKKYPDLKYEYRSLKVGDFTWIARHKVNKNQELVLPYIVERKRMDDLGASIKDGRFHEQKFRLRKCGLKNVIYLVESYGSNKQVRLPLQSLMQALANTRITDGFKVHHTDSLTDSVLFLAIMTRRLTIEFEDKNLEGGNIDPQSEGGELMAFKYFENSSIKNRPLTVKDTFIKLLLQLKGVSVEKALAITGVFDTPRLLIKAYDECSEKEGETLLANIKYGNMNLNVGPAVSRSIYRLFSTGK